MRSGKNSWQLWFLLAGFGAICFIYQSDSISNQAILPLLGAICLIPGAVSLRNGWVAEKRVLAPAAMQTGMGLILLGVGLVEAFQITLPETVWNLLLAAILGLLIVFGIVRAKGRK